VISIFVFLLFNANWLYHGWLIDFSGQSASGSGRGLEMCMQIARAINHGVKTLPSVK